MNRSITLWIQSANQCVDSINKTPFQRLRPRARMRRAADVAHGVAALTQDAQTGDVSHNVIGIAGHPHAVVFAELTFLSQSVVDDDLAAEGDHCEFVTEANDLHGHRIIFRQRSLGIPYLHQGLGMAAVEAVGALRLGLHHNPA